MNAFAGIGAALYAAGWEWRRRAYADGWQRPVCVDARVASIGNITVGGAGKTTLVLHLAAVASAKGIASAVVCRRYRPGPQGEGDEERMYRAALEDATCYAGTSKLQLAQQAAVAGAKLVLIDDGFSHWPLARDADVVLLDRTDLLGGLRLLPAGRLREPLRALQRASAIVVSRMGMDEDPQPFFDIAKRYAPGAQLSAGRHCPNGVRGLDGATIEPHGRARVLTATGNPKAVETSAREVGFAGVELAAYRDHHWWSEAQARAEVERAGEGTLVLTRKDAVRWPLPPGEGRVAVLDVKWEWLAGGAELERHVFEGA